MKVASIILNFIVLLPIVGLASVVLIEFSRLDFQYVRTHPESIITLIIFLIPPAISFYSLYVLLKSYEQKSKLARLLMIMWPVICIPALLFFWIYTRSFLSV